MSAHFADLTYEEAESLVAAGAHALLPTGAVEAHGPHLPLDTDVIIAREAAARAVAQLASVGVRATVLPPIAYSVAEYAAGFGGTLSLPEPTVRAYVRDVLVAAHRRGFRSIVVCNAHLEPANLGMLRAATDEAVAVGATVVFPDVTRKPHALRLGDEFRTGACHAGQYETSLVMAAPGTRVREAIRVGLADNPASLSVAIREGKRTFEDAGGPRAYFGWPERASVDEGNRLYTELADIFAAAVREAA